MVCETCTEAAIEDGAGDDIAEVICLEYGGDISDHDCEDRVNCECGCRRHREAAVQSARQRHRGARTAAKARL